jgi:hypothetical protein
LTQIRAQMTQPLLPDLPGFSIEQITLADGEITVLAQSHTTRACCPVCASLSLRVHSRYERTLADLPWSGRTVRLVVQVRRFFCQQPTCPRKTFVEAIPAVAERYARRTSRLKEVVEKLALAVGGEQGSRLAAILRMPCSPDTLCVCFAVCLTSHSSHLAWSVSMIGRGAVGTATGR